MSDQTSLVLEHLRSIRTTLGQHTTKLDSINARLVSIESHNAGLLVSDVDHSGRIEQIEARLGVIERRLEIAE